MALDYLLERTLRLKMSDEIEHSGLYPWAIVEVDDKGHDVGRDQIPWIWRESFTATEISFSDSIEMSISDPRGRETPKEVTERRLITAKLRPGFFRAGEFVEGAAFRMFGTDRVIRDFDVELLPVDKGHDDHNTCIAWSVVSFDSEVDYRTERIEDSLGFWIMIDTNRFDRYVDYLAHGAINEMTLTVASVDGFYSEWTPSVSTDIIKVLASEDQHPVVSRDDVGQGFPRIRKVGMFDLRLGFRKETTAIASASPY